MAGALQHIDARIRVSSVDEDFFILLEPLVDGLPGEGDAASQRRQVFIRRRNERQAALALRLSPVSISQ
ncbi:hypothetical protein [Mesorhizobium sp. M1342]|uniref:hypothetical protein n=1 Tax=Mesorhizobium sp. M1342 TaxID=2957088 RepID=UPI00333A31D7